MRGPRHRKVAAINAARDHALRQGVDVGGVIYHIDDTFLVELLAMVLGYQLGLLSGTQPIRTLQDTTRQMSLAQITALAGAVIARRKALYQASWAQKDSI